MNSPPIPVGAQSCSLDLGRSYNKLITDFTLNTSKYVFKGIAEFATSPPEIITGDNYEAKAGTVFDLLLRCKVNIFNISKINSEVRGAKSPRRREGPPQKIYTPSSRSARLTPAFSSSSPSGVVCVSHTENAPGSAPWTV
jgi:hypothetical protein